VPPPLDLAAGWLSPHGRAAWQPPEHALHRLEGEASGEQRYHQLNLQLRQLGEHDLRGRQKLIGRLVCDLRRDRYTRGAPRARGRARGGAFTCQSTSPTHQQPGTPLAQAPRPGQLMLCMYEAAHRVGALLRGPQRWGGWGVGGEGLRPDYSPRGLH
jgi:hypothetical protein